MEAGSLIRTRTRKNDWGLTGGGPIWIPKVYDGRNKTFFFFALGESSLELDQQHDLQRGSDGSLSQWRFQRGHHGGELPESGHRPLGRPIIQNAIYDPKTQRPVSATDPRLIRDQFPGNLIPPTSIDPVAAKVQALVPLPNLPGLISNQVNPFPVSSRYWIPSLKLDQQLSARQKLSFFWSLTRTASRLFGRRSHWRRRGRVSAPHFRSRLQQLQFAPFYAELRLQHHPDDAAAFGRRLYGFLADHAVAYDGLQRHHATGLDRALHPVRVPQFLDHDQRSGRLEEPGQHLHGIAKYAGWRSPPASPA